MKKVVINNCYGGFGLSAEAENLYAEKKGFKIYRYKKTKHSFMDGVDEFVKVGVTNDSMFVHTFTKDYGEKFNIYQPDSYWCSEDIERDDPVLVEVVEELGEAANGDCAELKIVEIPDGIEYTIENHNGAECIAEKHRTWG